MANVLYSPVPEVAASGPVPNAVMQLRTNPAEFGGLVGDALQRAGSDIKQGGSDLLNSAFYRQDLTNEIWANDANTAAMGKMTDAWSSYNKMEGRAAQDALPKFQEQVNSIYQSAIEQAPSLQTKAMLSRTTRQMADWYLRSGQNYADTQWKAWQDKSALEGSKAFYSQAALAVNDPKAMDTFLASGDDQIRKLGEQKGYDKTTTDVMISQARGAAINDIVAQKVQDGDAPGAKAILDRYSDSMDPASRLAASRTLHGYTRAVTAQSEADVALGKLGIGAGAVSDHGGAPPAGAQSNAVPHTSRPMPKEYADQGMSQADWDKMNAPDQGAQQPPATGGQPAGNAPTGPTPSHGAPGGSNTADAASVLRHFEGFRSSPYWDVNHFRVGYGSDTITKADGSVQTVTAGSRVSRDDAERDLARRAAQTAASASNQVGAQQWAQLPGPAQAALTSMAYNYGHLPENVVAAAKTGDVGQIASAVEAHGGDNGGVNSKRRTEEANIIRGGGFPGGPAPSGGQSGPQQPGQPVLPAQGGSIAMAQPTAIGQVHQQKADIYQDKAAVIDEVRQKYKDDPQMADAIVARVNQGISTEMLNQQAAKEQALADQDTAFNKYYTAAMKGQVPAAQLTQMIADDNTLTGQTKEHLNNAIQTMGQGKALGTDFYSYFQRVHSNGPDKITSLDQVLGDVDGNHLTIEGADKLRGEIAGKRTIDATATTEMMKGTLSYIKHNLSFEADYGTFKIPDPVGEDIFNSRAIPAFYKAYEDGLKSGKTPYDLLTAGSKDYVGDKIISTFKRTPAQEMKDKIAAGDQSVNNTPAGAPAAPVAPANFNLTAPDGVIAAYKAGSISRVEANQRLDAFRAAAQQQSSPQVPNTP